jgi:hypothetical protein
VQFLIIGQRLMNQLQRPFLQLVRLAFLAGSMSADKNLLSFILCLHLFEVA